MSNPVPNVIAMPLDGGRCRRSRARTAAGRILVTLELDEVATVELLEAAGVLERLQEHSREAIGHGLERLLELLGQEHGSGR